MIPGLILLFLMGTLGWFRAKQRGGTTADKLQFAAAFGIAGFLLGMIGMTVAGHLGWLGG